MIIGDQEVHLWHVYDEEIVEPSLLSRYFELLSEEELVQQKKFYFEKDRHQYLITRAMVRCVLSLYDASIAPDAWTFDKNDFGKPFISNSEIVKPVRFNISHTDKLVTIAVTSNQEVGVDVEYLPRLGKMLEIANRFFSPKETEHLFALPPEKRKNRFFDLWTLKEAYIKACGMGLSIPLDHFSYSFSQQGKITISFDPARQDQPDKWQFWQVHPNDTHKVSLAIKDEKKSSSYQISMREIIPLSAIKEVTYPIAHGSIITNSETYSTV
ncbi:4'-phosphopantetheinyl transferase family protein [Aliikangiella coralliicola]|uniref:4'-phosphopantetheinyl transferase superfamily protein n=1 Tax=Aliikangiella coralliicola TaxID=2592383 RepID=A0A545U936_9GAMM|nr:4'-phosphopantetheinyl transferase superfamily protein [Aliikangiella coralliicola]TQV85984.1 4'-phosphopantetheinyl transferase superfamily protein [Aliikangiella coralliicola]